MDLDRRTIVIIGGGIAGWSAATALARRGLRHITIIEEQSAIFSRASGLNAAIYRPLESDVLLAQLAAESLPIVQRLQKQTSVPLLRTTGLMLLDTGQSLLERMRDNAQAFGIGAEFLTPAQAARQVPGLNITDRSALFGEGGGVLDPHELGRALLQEAQLGGVELRLETRAQRLLFGGQGQCIGVEVVGGERLLADVVVLGAGAANGPLTYECAAPLPLLPLQRHLAIVEPSKPLAPHASVVWQLNPELYFRPESGAALVSPCDETPQPQGLAQTNMDALAPLAKHLEPLFPALANAKVRRVWACIRTKAPDSRPIVGPSPLISGLYYLAGLGGFGMSCGLACGEWLAESITSGHEIMAVSPARFYLPFLAGASSSNMRSAGV